MKLFVSAALLWMLACLWASDLWAANPKVESVVAVWNCQNQLMGFTIYNEMGPLVSIPPIAEVFQAFMRGRYGDNWRLLMPMSQIKREICV